jgi:hypothetical protein
METIRGEEQELRRVVHQASFEPGLMAMLALARVEQAKALAQWRRATGSDLVKYQAEYNTMQGVVDFIIKAPREFTKTMDTARPNTGEGT